MIRFHNNLYFSSLHNNFTKINSFPFISFLLILLFYTLLLRGGGVGGVEKQSVFTQAGPLIAVSTCKT